LALHLEEAQSIEICQGASVGSTINNFCAARAFCGITAGVNRKLSPSHGHAISGKLKKSPKPVDYLITDAEFKGWPQLVRANKGTGIQSYAFL
jgi:hypothetical protein